MHCFDIAAITIDFFVKLCSFKITWFSCLFFHLFILFTEVPLLKRNVLFHIYSVMKQINSWPLLTVIFWEASHNLLIAEWSTIVTCTTVLNHKGYIISLHISVLLHISVDLKKTLNSLNSKQFTVHLIECGLNIPV